MTMTFENQDELSVPLPMGYAAKIRLRPAAHERCRWSCVWSAREAAEVAVNGWIHCDSRAEAVHDAAAALCERLSRVQAPYAVRRAAEYFRDAGSVAAMSRSNLAGGIAEEILKDDLEPERGDWQGLYPIDGGGRPLLVCYEKWDHDWFENEDWKETHERVLMALEAAGIKLVDEAVRDLDLCACRDRCECGGDGCRCASECDCADEFVWVHVMVLDAEPDQMKAVADATSGLRD